jgi:hypothetical protein
MFSAQCDSRSSTHFLEIWPVINTTSLADSGTRISIPSNTETCLTVEYFFTFQAGDILQLYMRGDNSTDVSIKYIDGNTGTTPAIPNIPSIILTINQIR